MMKLPLGGLKTYIIALGIGVIAALQYLHVIPDSTADFLTTLLIGGGLAALRQGSKTDATKAVNAISADVPIAEASADPNANTQKEKTV